MSSEKDTHQVTAARRTQQRCRADFVQEVISVDEDKRRILVRMIPHPRRYKKIERDEPGAWYLDKYFDEIFRLEDFANSSMEGLPIFVSNRTVSSASEYASQRRGAVSHELETGDYVPPSENARPHTPLTASDDERDISFISLDICGSTAYQRRDPKGFKKAFDILLRELGTTVGQFQGSILKVTGDGFIAYLDFPGFTVLVDSTIDLCGTMMEVLHNAVNPALSAIGLDPLSVRIGADYGPAIVRELSVPLTGFSAPDVSSDALNRAVKIEQTCRVNTVRLGYDLYRLAHVQWLERCEKVEFDGGLVGIPGYGVYEFH